MALFFKKVSQPERIEYRLRVPQWVLIVLLIGFVLPLVILAYYAKFAPSGASDNFLNYALLTCSFVCLGIIVISRIEWGLLEWKLIMKTRKEGGSIGCENAKNTKVKNLSALQGIGIAIFIPGTVVYWDKNGAEK